MKLKNNTLLSFIFSVFLFSSGETLASSLEDSGYKSVEFAIQKDAYISLLANGGKYSSLKFALSKAEKEANDILLRNFKQDIELLVKGELSPDTVNELPTLQDYDKQRFSFEGTKKLSRLYRYYEKKLNNCLNTKSCIQDYEHPRQ